MPPIIQSTRLLTRVAPLCCRGRWNRLSRGGSVRAAAQETEKEAVIRPSLLDMRVGKVLTCERHPDADTLFIETVDVGEASPRTICSGLVPYMTAEVLLDAAVLVLCNLKARNFRGVKSHGMLLCASDTENGQVVPLLPPDGAAPGDRATVEGYDEEAPATENQVKKNKIWEKIQPLMKTNGEGVAQFDGKDMSVAAGNVTCTALPNASIS